MKRFILILASLTLVVLMMFSCRKTNDLPKPTSDPSWKTMLRDSIHKLDSLIMSTKIKSPAKAKLYSRQAIQVANEMHDQLAEARAFLLCGLTYLNSNPDSSFYYYSKAMEISDSLNDNNLKAQLLYNIASVYKSANDYRTAIMLFDSAKTLARVFNNPILTSDAYTALGNIYHSNGNINSAKESYDSAYAIAEYNGLKKQMGVALANLVQFESEAEKCISILKQAVALLQGVNGADEEIATIYMNLGYYFINPDSALSYYSKAIGIAQADSITEILLGTYNNMVYSYIDLGELDKAENCLVGTAIPMATADSNLNWLDDLYDSYADVLVAKDEYQKAFLAERKSMEVRAEFEAKRATSQIRLLAAVLDLKNKELLIREKSNQLQAEENKNRQIMLWLVIALLVAVGLGVLVFILSQRHRLKLQQQRLESATRIIEMEEKEKERIGKELHDLTGQMILEIAGELEQATFLDLTQQEMLLQRIRRIGSGIREISHRMAKPGMQQLTFSEQVTDLCESYRRSLGMDLRLNLTSELPVIPQESRLHLYRIIQELLTNAGKYARESHVSLTIGFQENKFELFYADEGPGFDPSLVKEKGIGFSIIFERVNLIGATATLDASPGAGTFWEIHVPFNRSVNTISSYQ